MVTGNWKVVVLGLCLGAAGCAQTYGTVMPKENGTYHVVEKGKTERETLKMAEHDAELTCKRNNKSKDFVTLEHSSEYVGMDVNKGNGTMSSIAANVVEFAGRMHNTENYRVEMTFRCG